MHDKINQIRKELGTEFIERDEEITGTLCAILSRQHLFMVGKPGTAKSMLIDALCERIDAAEYFQWLLTKFSTPEEVFGPISLSALEHDKYTRITTDKLPEAHIGFLDEALDLDTPIPTPSGWKTLRDIKIGDAVLGAKGNPVTVTDLTPIKKDGKCYNITFENGDSVVADGGHNWLCRRGRGGHTTPFKVRTTSEIIQQSKKQRNDWQVPLPDPIELDEVNFSIDPYVLGIWLGNGNSWTGEIYIRTELMKVTLAEVHKTLPLARCRIHPTMSEKLKVISVANTGFRDKLGTLGLIKDVNKYAGTGKHMPNQYLRGSIQQRLRMVQGLMDTDGYIQECGTCTFSNTNKSIIDGMAEILNSLGIRCSIKLTRDTRIGKRGPHKQCWKINFRANPELPPFLCRDVEIKSLTQRRHLKIESIKEVEPRPVRCITVDSKDHLFLAGNSMVVTHNCFKANSAILNALLTIANERKYHNNGKPVIVPLQSLFGASNELPESEELGALYDRFLLRYVINYIADDGDFMQMLKTIPNANPTTITLTDLEIAQAEVQNIAVPDDMMELLINIRGKMRIEGIIASDRRYKQSISILKAHAWLEGRTAVAEDDMEMLSHILWSQPREIKTVKRVILGSSNPLINKVMELLDQAEEIHKNCMDAAKDEDENSSTEGVEANAKLKKIGDQLNIHLASARSQGRKTKPIEDALDRTIAFNREILKECLGLEITD